MKLRKGGDDDVSLDSLLDTMTNVVGILLIVLVVTQLGVGEAVKRIGESIDVDSMKQARVSLDEALAEQEELAALVDTARTAPLDAPAELARLRRAIESHESELAAVQQRIQKQRETAKKIEADREELLRREAELRKQIEAALAQKAGLEARLEEMPQTQASDLPAKVVNLPDPRPAPKGVKPATILCREGKLYPLDVDGLRTVSQQRAKEVIERQRLDRDPKKGIDPERFVKAFNARKPINDYFRVTMTVKNDRQPWLVFERREGRGHPARVLGRRSSAYQKDLQTLDPKKYFAQFLVWSDSFETYLEARRVAADFGLLAGWSPQTTAAEYQAPLGGELALGPPPEPKPTPPKPTTTPPKPAPPPRPMPLDTVD